jgi:maltokinase
MNAGAGLPGGVESWLSRQRWYRAKGSAARLRLIGGFTLIDPAAEADVVTHLLEDSSSDPPTLYQVPVTYRRTSLKDADRSLLGTISDDLGMKFVYDAPYDPAYSRALLALVTTQASTAHYSRASAEATGHLLSPTAATEVVQTSVFTGEQSNTSFVLELQDAVGHTLAPMICKLFRSLEPGANPDIDIQTALSAAGYRRIPAPLGFVAGTWPAKRGIGQPSSLSGHLAFIEEFIPGSENGWDLALRAVAAKEDFTGSSRELGIITAEVHELLAASMGTEESSTEMIHRTTADMRERLGLALVEVPELAPYRDAIEDLFAAASHSCWPPLQRIHGDLHLGQTIHSPERGWILLDFEGEPLRPLGQRSERDVSLRDLAGMLRSFDYAACAAARNRVEGDSAPDSSMPGWAEVERHSFLCGYESRSGLALDQHGALLKALEVDKALYETIYETRNRPDWLPIPLTAIHRLVTPNE